MKIEDNMTIVRPKITKPPKKMKWTTFRNKADAMFSKIVKSGGACEWCGKTIGQLHCHHVIGRTNKRLRWNLRNGVCLCAGCHKMNAGNAHDDPIEFLEWFEEHRPEDYKYIYKVRYELWDGDYDLVLNYLKENA